MLIILLFTGTICYGQEKDSISDLNKNRTEIKFNAFAITATSSLELEIERTLSKRSSVGLSFFTNFKDPEDELVYNGIQNSLTAYYRFYLGKKYNQGFFLEGFGMYNTSNSLLPGNASPKRYTITKDFALGLGIGYKYVTKKGLILQANYGWGKNLLEPLNGESTLVRVGVSVGFSF